MAASIMQVARRLGQLSGWTLSNLKMQKIGFIAEMLHLGREREPLINEQWQAWSYGPVQPDLYHQVKMFGADPVRDIFYAPAITSGTRGKAIEDAYEIMKDLSPSEMINTTHQSDGAWAKSYSSNIRNAVIPKAAILEEYNSLIVEDD